MEVNINLNSYSDEDLYLLKDKIDCLIHARIEADKKAKINKFYDAFMALKEADISVYTRVPDIVYDGCEISEFPLDWEDFRFE